MRDLSEQLTREPLLLERLGGPGRSNKGRTGFIAQRVGAGQFSRQGKGPASRGRDYQVGQGGGYSVDPYTSRVIGRGKPFDKSLSGVAQKARQFLMTTYGVRGPKPHVFGR